MKKKPMSEEDALEKCRECGNACCRYITVKIPAPRSMNDCDFILWQLYHDNVKAYKDSSGWHLIIYNACAHLKDDGKCAIYEKRPITCRAHSNETCEVNGPISEWSSLFFDDHRSFEKFCKKKFKTWDRRASLYDF
jgi:Fe-S-cluster containining protein